MISEPATRPSATGLRTLRQPTLDTLGLGSVLELLRSGRLPVSAEEMVEAVFGPPGDRGALVISGASGIVGAGKTMQLGARLVPHGVTVVALDLPGAPDGIGRQVPGLVRAFGRAEADRILAGIVRLTYDGKSLPPQLASFRPRFLLEAVPEVLELKRAHYALFRDAFPDLEIRSVTSGFPSRELGVAVAHPAFPHEVNKLFETVEAGPSRVPQLLWSLGLVPVPVADEWSFVLDVVFCGLTNAALRWHRASNMPFWKVDKLVRRMLGPNPFRAHDAIGAKGANFLTWSCLHHLEERYGELFAPAPELVERKETGQPWYPPNHFRPVVDWPLAPGQEEELRTWVLGPLVQMTALMVHEKRAHLAHLNLIGELCAQLRSGAAALVRGLGAAEARRLVESYHRLHPAAAGPSWHPEALERIDTPEWQQLYVNAEHDGAAGVITLGREAYNWDVDAELNRAIDWLRAEGIERVVLTGDFHLTTQLVGADTAEFFPALDDEQEGFRVSAAWSRTARRLHEELRTSVALVAGKRCLGGMLELMLHCHHLVAVDGASLGFPEVTLPVLPGMEGTHWPFRKARREDWPRVMELLLSGKPVRGAEAVGWLVDVAAPLEGALRAAWELASGDATAAGRVVEEGALRGVAAALPPPGETGEAGVDAARLALRDAVVGACSVPLADALELQARRSASFMTGKACRAGVVGTAAARLG
jgi:enoyl-CoA hydratase/carnithine racemase